MPLSEMRKKSYPSRELTGFPVRRFAWKMLVTASLPVLLSCCTATTGSVGAPPFPPPLAQTQYFPATQVVAAPAHEALAMQPPPKAPNGSLWSHRTGSLYQDIKARNIGDVLTIVVSEESQASKSSQTGTNRSRNFSGSASLGGMTAGDKTLLGPVNLNAYQAEFGSGFKGQGTVSNKDSMMAYMTATVVDILPNGNLFIRGSRWTKVNNEMQQIVLEGVVRPNDINRNNAVLSQNIADAKIFFEGKGPVSQNQRPGWALQLLDIIFPF